jgi:predicted enzyme related to lactoylglutathione lyase
MKKTAFIIIGLVISFCCGFFLNMIVIKKTGNKTESTQTDQSINMRRVTGIGGIFFKCKDPIKIKEWYKTHLGLNTDRYGASFVWKEGNEPGKTEILQWSPFSETTTYFEPSTKDYMINYRVEDLVGLVKQLKKEGVTIVDKIENDEYGKFIHIMDIEGNKIELYEPNYEYLKKIKTNS